MMKHLGYLIMYSKRNKRAKQIVNFDSKSQDILTCLIRSHRDSHITELRQSNQSVDAYVLDRLSVALPVVRLHDEQVL